MTSAAVMLIPWRILRSRLQACLHFYEGAFKAANIKLKNVEVPGEPNDILGSGISRAPRKISSHKCSKPPLFQLYRHHNLAIQHTTKKDDSIN